MKTLTVAEFHAALDAQGVACREDLAFRCPMCGTVQTARNLIDAGAGVDFDAVEKYLGFSCVGRWTGAAPPRKTPDGRPCNWTLGGLFGMQKMEIVDEHGKKYPMFEVATPEEARAHCERHAKEDAS